LLLEVFFDSLLSFFEDFFDGDFWLLLDATVGVLGTDFLFWLRECWVWTPERSEWLLILPPWTIVDDREPFLSPKVPENF